MTLSPRLAARTPARAALFVLAAAVLFSTGGAAIKATDLSGLQVACLRSGIAAVALLVVLPSARRGWSWRTWLVGAGFAVTLILFVQANKLTTAANAIFLQSTSPLYLLILGPLVLKEPVRRRDLIFMGVVGVGMMLFFVSPEPARDTATDPVLGNVLALLSGVGWAFTVGGLRWLARGGVRGAAASGAVAGNAIACVVCLPAFAGGVSIGASDIAVVAYLGIFQIALAYVFLTSALASAGALEASLLLYLEPALNPVWAWLVHGETPAGLAIVGGVIIILATLFRTAREVALARHGPPRAADDP